MKNQEKAYEAWCFANLQRAKISGTNKISSLCPVHEDHNPSFCVNLATGWCSCYACGVEGYLDVVADAAGLNVSALPKPEVTDSAVKGMSFNEVRQRKADAQRLAREKKEAEREIAPSSKPYAPAKLEAEYIYNMPDHTPHMLVKRWRQADGKKAFSQYHWDGKNWVKGLRDKETGQNTTPVIYHLPDILAAPGEPVLFVEGEKDADNGTKLGFLTTTAPMGAGGGKIKLATDSLRYLEGHEVFIIPDNDLPGNQHAAAVADELLKLNIACRIVNLPNVPEKGDLSDWIALGGTADQLRHLMYTSDSVKDKQLPTVYFGRNINQPATQALLAIARRDRKRTIFNKGEDLVELCGGKKFNVISLDRMLGLMDRSVCFVRLRSDDREVPSVLPRYLAADALSRPPSERDMFPVVQRIVQVPVFSSEGRYVTEPGYQEETQLFLAPQREISEEMPETVTEEDVTWARDFLTKDVLADFPFADSASCAHTLAAMLQTMVRPMFKGPTPLYLLAAPAAGTGKTLLASVIVMCALGVDSPQTINPPVCDRYSSSGEWSKLITTILSDAPTYVLFDNMIGSLTDPSLDAVLTSTTWSARELGKNRKLVYDNYALWVGTGNNLTFSPDAARRLALIYLNAKTQNPESRDPAGFKHPEIMSWCQENFGRIQLALYTLVKWWLQKGRPKGVKAPGVSVPGTFEGWFYTIGGILQCCGIDGMCTNKKAVNDLLVSAQDDWAVFYAAWLNSGYRDKELTIAEIEQFCTAAKLLESVINGKTEQARRTSLGMKLKKQVGVTYDGYMLEQRTCHNHARVFYLTCVDPTAEVPVMEVPMTDAGSPAPSASSGTSEAKVSEDVADDLLDILDSM